MSAIKYIKGDLFSAPTGSILAHSCNCYGSWGGGVAAIFKKKFPESYQVYHDHCKKHDTKDLLGTCLLIPTNDTEPGGGSNRIACLFTSGRSGQMLDPPDMIVKNTEKAVAHLLNQLSPDAQQMPIHMPKINAGIFNVPWENTAKALEKFNHQFIVYEL